MALRLSRALSDRQRPLNRTQFLRGNWRGVAEMITPPWALADDNFFRICTQCSECVTACEAHILRVNRAGYPQVDFRRGECSFCGDCERACKPGALSDDGQAPWHYQAQINNQCLSIKGVMCRTCSDCCDTQAISFKLAVGGVASPRIDPEYCTACGACIAPCPTNSIEITTACSHAEN